MPDHGSARTRQARFSVLLDHKPVRLVLWVVSIGSLAGWLYFVWFEQVSMAHLLLISAAWPLLPLAWYAGWLRELPVSASSTIDGTLDRRVLGRLPRDATPQQIAEIVSTQNGGYFFGARFAIARDFLAQLSSTKPEDSETIWRSALDMQQRLGEQTVSDAAVFAALVFALPEYQFYLAQLNLDREDIEAGLKWHAHIKELIAVHNQKKYHGGIGRDLSFGWAPLLNRVGLNISQQLQSGGILHRPVESRQEVLTQMVHLLSQPGQRNVTLVGEVGTGKTTLVYALAQQLLEGQRAVGDLAYQQVVTLDSATLIAQAKGRGELEQLLIRIFNEAVHAKNIIIFLDEAQLFLQEGTGSVDLSSILLQVLEGGALRLILAMSDQQWLQLSQANPGLAQLMNRVVVNPLDQTDTMRVVEDQVLLLEARHKVTYMYQSLSEAHKLAERFIREQAFPGKAIKLLDAAAGFPEEKHFVTAKSVQQAVEKNFDVKIQTASSSEERDTLLNLEGKIHERMINQTRAVQVVSDALRRARAGVRNQARPIGTFLFLGPTGVGKTELSKSLAAVYFGGEERMVRVDLNEYSQSSDVTRLIAPPSQFADSLCAQIAKQPFSVVLLDEIEKAHPNVLNVLLQMLDEGILRDAENKEVSFRDAIIIATSNAGADTIRKHIESGETLEQFEDQFINELIDTQVFKPEFINRFDETVLFRPLNVDELKQVVTLIVNGVNKNLASQKVSVKLTEAAKQFLAETGYDPRLGARPLRRVVQRSIENVVAQKLLENTVTPGSTIELDTPELQSALQQRQG